MKRLDITGERYGKLVAVRRLPTHTPSRWVLKCDCGNKTEALLSNLRSGQVQSCGCAGSQATIGARSLKHGHSAGFRKSRTATAWRNAKTRCFNKKNAKYPAYGGRGITMCPEWAEDFSTFLRDMGECPEGLTLERIDVNGNYEPGNCCWATMREQHNNKRDSIRSSGVSLKEFAAATGLRYQNLHRRIKRYGETPEEAAAWYEAKRLRSAQSRTHARQN